MPVSVPVTAKYCEVSQSVRVSFEPRIFGNEEPSKQLAWTTLRTYQSAINYKEKFLIVCFY